MRIVCTTERLTHFHLHVPVKTSDSFANSYVQADASYRMEVEYKTQYDSSILYAEKLQY